MSLVGNGDGLSLQVGNKIRLLPLASETVHLLDHYLRLERPAACYPSLFVSLKGPARGYSQ